MLYLSFPSLYWGLVNVPRQKAQVSHLICFYFLRNDSLVMLVVPTLSIFVSYIWSFFSYSEQEGYSGISSQPQLEVEFCDQWIVASA